MILIANSLAYMQSEVKGIYPRSGFGVLTSKV